MLSKRFGILIRGRSTKQSKRRCGCVVCPLQCQQNSIRHYLKFTVATSAWLQKYLGSKGSAAWNTYRYSNKGSSTAQSVIPTIKLNVMIMAGSAMTRHHFSSIQTQRREMDGTVSLLPLTRPSWISSVCSRSWCLTLLLPPSYAFGISAGGRTEKKK